MYNYPVSLTRIQKLIFSIKMFYQQLVTTVLFAFAISTPVNAVSVSSSANAVSTGLTAGSDTGSQSAATGSVSANAVVGVSGVPEFFQASSSADVNGSMRVFTDSQYGAIANQNFILDANATWSETLTNSSSSVQLYNFDFLAPSGKVTTGLFGIAATDRQISSYSIDIRLDGTSLFTSSGSAQSAGGVTSVSLSGVNLGGATTSFYDPVDRLGFIKYEWAEYSDTVNFSLAAGQTATLEYVMNVGMDVKIEDTTLGGACITPGQTLCFGSAEIGNPTDAVISLAVSAVPVPATVWLLASGFMGLIGVARRKQAAQVTIT